MCGGFWGFWVFEIVVLGYIFALIYWVVRYYME